MPSSKYANQKRITVHREEKSAPFLAISKNTMFEAYKNLNNAYTFALYLYLAANADGYTFDFSPENVHEEMGMPPSTCRDQVKRLIKKGYLVNTKDNMCEFYETPISISEITQAQDETENSPTVE